MKNLFNQFFVNHNITSKDSLIQLLKRHMLRLINHAGFMNYFRNTSYLITEKVIRIIVGLFVGLWVARYLGPEQFGLLNYAQSFVALFAAVASLGIDSIVVRDLVKNETQSSQLLSTAFILKLISAIVTLIILFITINLTSSDSHTKTLVYIIASSTIFQAFNVVDLYFQAKVLSRFVVYANIFSLLLSSIVKILLILNQASLENFAWTVLFDSFVLALGFLYIYLKHSVKTVKKLIFSKTIALYLLKESWPLFFGGLFVSAYMRIDQVMIQSILNNKSVGYYAAAVRISELWYFIPMVISASFFPAIINAKKQNIYLYHSRLQKLYTAMVWLALTVAIITTLLAENIVQLFYGLTYIQAAKVLKIHIWSGIFVSLGVASEKWFIAEDYQILSFWRVFYGMLINIILNIVLIPKYGISGAASATLCANFMAAFFFDFFHNKTKKLFYMKLKAFLPIIK